jgi:hypothetical protein
MGLYFSEIGAERKSEGFDLNLYKINVSLWEIGAERKSEGFHLNLYKINVSLWEIGAERKSDIQIVSVSEVMTSSQRSMISSCHDIITPGNNPESRKHTRVIWAQDELGSMVITSSLLELCAH